MPGAVELESNSWTVERSGHDVSARLSFIRTSGYEPLFGRRKRNGILAVLKPRQNADCALAHRADGQTRIN